MKVTYIDSIQNEAYQACTRFLSVRTLSVYNVNELKKTERRLLELYLYPKFAKHAHENIPLCTLPINRVHEIKNVEKASNFVFKCELSKHSQKMTLLTLNLHLKTNLEIF